MESPTPKMSLRRGWRKAILKAQCPPATVDFFLLLQSIIMVPTLGPLDLNFLSLGCFSTRLSQGRLLPILRSHCKYHSLPPHPNNATYLKKLNHLFGFIFFIAHLLFVFNIYYFLSWRECQFRMDRDLINLVNPYRLSILNPTWYSMCLIEIYCKNE